MQEAAPVTFRSALRHLEDYVVLEQIRFGDQIRFQTDIQVDQFMMPPMLIQPLVENAIRHGLNPKPEGGTITLRTRREEDWIRVEIEDDGVGFDDRIPAGKESVGLRNVRFRLKHMMNGTLQIRSTPGTGTVATILIPREEEESCG
jgi:sensor histidine kinase YesM